MVTSARTVKEAGDQGGLSEKGHLSGDWDDRKEPATQYRGVFTDVGIADSCQLQNPHSDQPCL